MKVKIGRNDPCPCGSGEKYKKCCLGKLLICEAPGCEVTIPRDLKDGHGILELCGAMVFGRQWGLCPEHAKEWQELGHRCDSLEHYREWQVVREGLNS